MLQNGINYITFYMEYCYYDMYNLQAFQLLGLKLCSKTNKWSNNSHKYPISKYQKITFKATYCFLKKIKANSRTFFTELFFIDRNIAIITNNSITNTNSYIT